MLATAKTPMHRAAAVVVRAAANSSAIGAGRRSGPLPRLPAVAFRRRRLRLAGKVRAWAPKKPATSSWLVSNAWASAATRTPRLPKMRSETQSASLRVTPSALGRLRRGRRLQASECERHLVKTRPTFCEAVSGGLRLAKPVKS